MMHVSMDVEVLKTTNLVGSIASMHQHGGQITGLYQRFIGGYP
jgi:hypothetical protein